MEAKMSGRHQYQISKERGHLLLHHSYKDSEGRGMATEHRGKAMSVYWGTGLGKREGQESPPF